MDWRKRRRLDLFVLLIVAPTLETNGNNFKLVGEIRLDVALAEIFWLRNLIHFELELLFSKERREEWKTRR